jgi:hypothetical protein
MNYVLLTFLGTAALLIFFDWLGNRNPYNTGDDDDDL